MIVSAWHDGHGSYGLRVAGDGVGLWFRPEWKWVTVHLPGEQLPAAIALTPSFWKSNPELRSPRLRRFFESEGLVPWSKNRPPQFELEPVGGGVFRLRRLASALGTNEEENPEATNVSFGDFDGVRNWDTSPRREPGAAAWNDPCLQTCS